MKFAIVVDSKVENIVLAEHGFGIEQGWIELPDNEAVGIGWGYDGTKFIAPLIDPAQEEERWQHVRKIRDRLLQESDHYMLVDVFNSLATQQQNEYIEYRQKLRDIPQDYQSVADINWPQKPRLTHGETT